MATRNRVERYRRDQSEALGILDGFPSKLSALDQSLARARAETAAARSASPSELGQLRSERDALNGRCSSYKAAKTLDERVALMPPETKEYAEANEVKKRLADLEAEKRRAYAPSLTGEQREQLAKLSGSINRLRGKLGTLAGTPYGEAKNQLNLIDTSIRRLERSSEQLRQTESSIEKEIEWLNQKKVSSETELRRLEKIDLSSENRTTAEKYEYLRAGGYGEDLLRPHLTIIATDFVAAVG